MNPQHTENIDIGVKQFILLNKIRELSNTKDTLVPNAVSIGDLVGSLNSNRSAVAKMLSSAKKSGFVKNSVRGYWSLTSKGRYIIEHT